MLNIYGMLSWAACQWQFPAYRVGDASFILACLVVAYCGYGLLRVRGIYHEKCRLQQHAQQLNGWLDARAWAYMLSGAAYTLATLALHTGKYVWVALIVLVIHGYLCSDAMRTKLGIELALAIVVDTNLLAYVVDTNAHNVYTKLVMSIIASIAMWLLASTVVAVVGWFMYDRTTSKVRRWRTPRCSVTRLPTRRAG